MKLAKGKSIIEGTKMVLDVNNEKNELKYDSLVARRLNFLTG